MKPSAIPVTIVCGPPAAGKTRYVAEHQQPGDIVIDLDAITARLTGLPWYHPSGDAHLHQAIAERNRMLELLATERQAKHAWLIVSAPTQSERAWWRSALGGEIVLLDTPADVCIQRIDADERRRGREAHYHRAVKLWWARHSR